MYGEINTSTRTEKLKFKQENRYTKIPLSTPCDEFVNTTWSSTHREQHFSDKITALFCLSGKNEKYMRRYILGKQGVTFVSALFDLGNGNFILIKINKYLLASLEETFVDEYM